MLEGFPDAVMCGENEIFWLRSYEYYNTIKYWMADTTGGDIVVDFNVDKTFKSIWPSGSTTNQQYCIDSSISQLYTNGRAFNIVTSRQKSETDSMVPNRPDCILCVTTNYTFYAYLHTKSDNDGKLVYKIRQQGNVQIRFNSDDAGTFYDRSAFWLTDGCANKSLYDFYDEK